MKRLNEAQKQALKEYCEKLHEAIRQRESLDRLILDSRATIWRHFFDQFESETKKFLVDQTHYVVSGSPKTKMVELHVQKLTTLEDL